MAPERTLSLFYEFCFALSILFPRAHSGVARVLLQWDDSFFVSLLSPSVRLVAIRRSKNGKPGVPFYSIPINFCLFHFKRKMSTPKSFLHQIRIATSEDAGGRDRYGKRGCWCDSGRTGGVRFLSLSVQKPTTAPNVSVSPARFGWSGTIRIPSRWERRVCAEHETLPPVLVDFIFPPSCFILLFPSCHFDFASVVVVI